MSKSTFKNTFKQHCHTLKHKTTHFNNITHISIHFFTYKYIKNIQTTLLKPTHQTSPIYFCLKNKCYTNKLREIAKYATHT